MRQGLDNPQRPATDVAMAATMRDALTHGPLPVQLAIPQPSKETALLADKAYNDKRGVAQELVGVWAPHELPLSEGLRDPRNEAMLFVAWARWWAHQGFNVFRVDEGLFSRLALTDPPELPIEELQPPFAAFRIEVPEGFLPIASTEKQIRWIRWIDVLRLPPIIGESVRGPEAAAAAVNPASVVWSTITVEGERAAPGVAIHPRWAVWCRSADYAVAGSLTSFQKAKGIPISQWIHGENTALDMAFDLEIEAASMQSCIRVLVNLCLAMESHAIKPQKYEHKHPSRNKVARPTTFHFGKSTVDVHVLEAAKAVGHGRAAHASWKIRAKFIVRGHWRDQACGPRHSERKRIFIEPYWKGDDLADGYAHLYNGKDPAT